ncbi:MAG: 30S ribosome-binding factor RbfA [Gammaproteobacteria bacterium]|nr:30S ribosome-binding factor RbfA [Gammaproteobacteria bacterium]
MARDFDRSRRVGEQIQRELSELVRREIKDPRLGMVTISGVEVSKDFSTARVFITVLGKERSAAEEDLEILNHAAGHLRGLLGRSIRLRHIPKLSFFYDAAIDSGARMDALIDAAVASDHHDKDE